MNLRRATIADSQSLADFNRKMAWETEGIKLKPEVILQGVENMINTPSMGFYLVIEVDGELQASLMITTEWSDWRNGLFWWIQSVYVTPDYRRKGLYRAMYDKVRELAGNEPNVCGFRLYVERENIPAQKTYQSLGMEETEYHLYEELKPGLQFLED